MAAPSGLLLRGAGDSPRARSKGGVPLGSRDWGARRASRSDHPPGPLLRGWGKQKVLGEIWGTPPGLPCPRALSKGCALWAPRLSAGGQPQSAVKGLRPLGSRDWGVRRASRSDHPPGPLPKRKGGVKRNLGDTPRPLPDGCALWTPRLQALGDSPRPLPEGPPHLRLLRCTRNDE